MPLLWRYDRVIKIILYTLKKGTQKNTEMPNPFHGRNADIVWQELLQNSKPVSREEIIRRLGSKPHQKKITESKD